MDYETRRQASEAIKDLMVQEKRSKLPLILGVLVVLALAAGGYWYSQQPPDKRPTFADVKHRGAALTKSILNSPIVSPSAGPQGSSTSTSKKPTPSGSADSGGLLSN